MSKKNTSCFALTHFGMQINVTFKEGWVTQCTVSTCGGTQNTLHHMFDNVQQSSKPGWKNCPREGDWWLLEGTVSTVFIASWPVWLRSGAHSRSSMQKMNATTLVNRQNPKGCLVAERVQTRHQLLCLASAPSGGRFASNGEKHQSDIQ